MRLSAREARERRDANEERLRRLLDEFGALGFDPVVLGTDDPSEIDQRVPRLGRAAREDAVAALRVAAAAAVLALGLAAQAAATDTPIPTTTLGPTPAHVGDRITATVSAVVDRSVVDPAAVHPVADFGPLDVLSGPVRERADQGTLTRLRFTWRLACLSEDCVPAGSPRRIVLPPVRLTGTTVSLGWPRLTIVSRVSAKDAAAARPPFRLETQLPRPTYRVSPGLLALVLDVLAAALVLVAALLVGRELARRRRRREEERLAALSPLERALVYARDAERRGPVERRKALGLLARVLGGREEQLAGTASELAWSPQRPSPEQVESLVGDVEREVGPR